MTREEVWVRFAAAAIANRDANQSVLTTADEGLAEFDKRFPPVAAFSIAGDGKMTTYSQQELDAMREESPKHSTAEPDFEMPERQNDRYIWPDGSLVRCLREHEWFSVRPDGEFPCNGFRSTAREAAAELYRLGLGPGAGKNINQPKGSDR